MHSHPDWKVNGRIYCLFVTLVFIHTSCEGGSQRTVTITLPGNVVAPPTVSVKEGDSITLSCRTDVEDTSIVWTKAGDADFYHNGEDLILEKVHLNHGGVYTCTINDQTGNNVTGLTGNAQVDLNILYGPGRVIITGPMSSLKYENFSLSCSSQGNPDPVYRWTLYNKDTPTVQRGSVFMETNFNSDSELNYICIAESSLIPTQGDSLTASAEASKQVTKHEPVNIWELQDDYYVEEGDTLDISCKTAGYPYPIGWWTKAGNFTVINNGHRLVVPNIKRHFDGYYTCYGENSIINSQGSKRLVTDTRNTYIHVKKKDSTNETQTPCSPKCNTTLTGPDFSEETCAAKCNIPTGTTGEKKQTDEGCSNAIISALVIGWILVTILIVIGLFYHIRVRHARTSDVWIKHHNSKDQTGKTFASKSENTTNGASRDRPELPTRPEEPAAVDRGTPDGSNSKPVLKLNLYDDDGYITPKTNLSGSGAYEEPYLSLTPVSKESDEINNGAEYEIV